MNYINKKIHAIKRMSFVIGNLIGLSLNYNEKFKKTIDELVLCLEEVEKEIIDETNIYLDDKENRHGKS